MAGERRNQDKRPSPDALLQAGGAVGRGRLKVFLGAAPGVGKTFEMLQSARARKAEGVDVVIGVVETHGRKETQALVDGFEIIPRRETAYRGRTLNEMDLDGLLARKPALALVDELAHANAPGSRHPKRYLDVDELLAAGIDVYTTLNVQHIESLNDVVAQITRIRVRETVPDAVLDRADAIELIDLTPDDLIKRLQEGKVYTPKTATRALGHYFSEGNLTALRELALRRTAQRVDEQLLTHMQSRAISGPWPAGERVLVCVSEDPRAAGLVRYARRLADKLHAPWTALCVESPRSAHMSEEERDRIAEALRLAEKLGAEAITIPSAERRIADDVLAYAREHNLTHIVVGKSHRSRWFEIVNGSVVHDLVRRAGPISVHVIAGDEPGADASAGKAIKSAPPARRSGWFAYAVAMAGVAAAVIVGHAVQPVAGVENVDLIFLTAIVAVAVRFGLWPSLAAVAAASLSYNFFFLPPLHTLTIADPTNVAALIFFTIVAVLVSNLAGRVRSQAMMAQGRARATEALYGFSRKLAGTATLDDVLWATAFQIASMLKVRVILLLPENGAIAPRAGYPPEDSLDEADIAAAKWCYENNHPAGRGADTLPGAKRLFLPMRTGRGLVGVIGLDSDKEGPFLTPEQRRLLDALCDQSALAIERVNLVQDVDRAARAAEADRLRQALLTSISHDLKTPLASIIGSADTLKNLSSFLNGETKSELLDTIQDEAERLNRFIANLLDMTKLESGALEPNASMVDIGEVIGSALKRAAKVLADHRIDLSVAADAPMVRLDAVLFEQVLFNLLDNAAKYSPKGSTVDIRCWAEQKSVIVQVLDEGEGVPPDDLERIFDKFYRVRHVDRVRAGTGLGLPICRGFIEAMGGRIVAANRSDRSGAVFTVSLASAPAIRRDVAA